MPIEEDLPSTLERSGAKAQRTFTKAHDAAVEEYGEGRRAHQTAFSALKHTHEKVGDHWEPKDHKGPSDEHAAGDASAKTAGGVDSNATKSHLLELARRLEVPGRSKMKKSELVEALQKANRSATSAARR